jgi:hypothetical protein
MEKRKSAVIETSEIGIGVSVRENKKVRRLLKTSELISARGRSRSLSSAHRAEVASVSPYRRLGDCRWGGTTFL